MPAILKPDKYYQKRYPYILSLILSCHCLCVYKTWLAMAAMRSGPTTSGKYDKVYSSRRYTTDRYTLHNTVLRWADCLWITLLLHSLIGSFLVLWLALNNIEGSFLLCHRYFYIKAISGGRDGRNKARDCCGTNHRRRICVLRRPKRHDKGIRV